MRCWTFASRDRLNFAALVLRVPVLGLDTPSLRDVAFVLGLKRLNEGQSAFGSLLGRELIPANIPARCFAARLRPS
jgi:hypothetical protein